MIGMLWGERAEHERHRRVSPCMLAHACQAMSGHDQNPRMQYPGGRNEYQ